MRNDLPLEELIVFPSELGWMSLRMRGAVVRQLSFGHLSAAAAIQAIAAGELARREPSKQQIAVVERLQRFAEGEPIDFRDLAVDVGPATEFQTRVLKACREIPYGQTLTYGELAARASAPKAARAVGNCMAANRVPLIIPCHRVVRAGGDIGPYSAAAGSATKRRLLTMEAGNLADLVAKTPSHAGKTAAKPVFETSSRSLSTNARYLG